MRTLVRESNIVSTLSSWCGILFFSANRSLQRPPEGNTQLQFTLTRYRFQGIVDVGRGRGVMNQLCRATESGLGGVRGGAVRDSI